MGEPEREEQRESLASEVEAGVVPVLWTRASWCRWWFVGAVEQHPLDDRGGQSDDVDADADADAL